MTVHVVDWGVEGTVCDGNVTTDLQTVETRETELVTRNNTIVYPRLKK